MYVILFKQVILKLKLSIRNNFKDRIQCSRVLPEKWWHFNWHLWYSGTLDRHNQSVKTTTVSVQELGHNGSKIFYAKLCLFFLGYFWLGKEHGGCWIPDFIMSQMIVHNCQSWFGEINKIYTDQIIRSETCGNRNWKRQIVFFLCENPLVFSQMNHGNS